MTECKLVRGAALKRRIPELWKRKLKRNTESMKEGSKQLQLIT